MKTLFALLLFVALTACNRPEPSAEAAPSAEIKTPKNEVMLSPQEQATAKIETEPAILSRQPEMLRVKGRIAIDDSRTWRLSVRTTGSVTKVFAGLGDAVKKGQILARFHADEVRDTRAMYRVAVSERQHAESVAAQAQRNLDRANGCCLLELRRDPIQQVEIAQQEVIGAKAAIQKAEIEVDRTKDLLEDDLKVPAEPTANRQDETEDEETIIATADGVHS